jgi:hypothetical protein
MSGFDAAQRWAAETFDNPVLFAAFAGDDISELESRAAAESLFTPANEPAERPTAASVTFDGDIEATGRQAGAA